MAHIEYPAKTSEWGKVLIDRMNIIVTKMDNQMECIIDNIKTEFRAFREEINVKIDEIKTTAENALALAKQNEQFNKETRSNLDDFRQTYEVSHQSVIDEMTLMKESNKKLCSENEHLRFQCEYANGKYKTLQQQTNNGENYSRRKNLVIRGIDEVQQETDDICELATRNFLKAQLKLSDAVVDEMQLVRCHRMGPKFRRTPRRNQQVLRRPIIIRFGNFKDKSVVWKGKSNITDNKFSISENFSRDTEYNRRKLYAIYKKAKNMEKYKKKVSLNGDMLIIDSVKYNAGSLHMLPKDLDPREFGERTDGNYMIIGGIHSSYQPLSNWYSCEVNYKGHTFNSVEQGYQWSKATFANDVTAARNLLYTTDPREAKDLGMNVQGLQYADWNSEKDTIMRELVTIKFTDNIDLKNELLGTGDLKLAEAGLDTHFAIGLSLPSVDIFDSDKWKGQNLLGKILCDVRAQLKT